MEKTISVQGLKRMPTYLNYLKSLSKESELNISAKTIADAVGLGEIQVRKDLAAVSEGGKPKIGYIKEDLIRDIEVFLGYDDINDAVLIGAGKLGKALLSYDGFKNYGLNIVAAFDIDDDKIGSDESGKEILSVTKLKNMCDRMKIKMGIITVPAQSAQTVCDMLVDSGITAIWNFAPVHLKASDDIMIKNEDMAASLALLSKHIADKIYE